MKKNNIVAIIQARMGSTRLPGKVLMDVCGKPILEHVIERTKKCKEIDSIVVATTNRVEDKVIIKLAKKCKTKSFTGSEKDVLDRYYQAAKKFNANIIVRITADCPLIDSLVIDKVVKYHLENQREVDYTTKPRAYPEGLDVEVFSFEILKKAWKEAKKPSEREHVTPYILNHPEIFYLSELSNDINNDFSSMHWSVDEEQDLKFVKKIYKKLYKDGEIFYMEDVLKLLKEQPELMEINKGFTGYEGYQKSLKNDRVVKHG
jgi:spore coat polysaccharide biosynthesis protein SpsF